MKKVLLMSLASVVIGVNLTNASQTSKNVTNTLSTSTNTQNQETTNSLVTKNNNNVNNNTVTNQQVANTLENNVENNNTSTNQTTTENIVGPNVGSLNKNTEQNQQNSNIVPNQGMDTKNNDPYAQYFTGSTYFKVLVEKDNIWNSSINNLTFLAGSRSNWHKYSGGHIILVTSGEGRYQEKGKQIQVLKAGDVVKVVPNIEHWYGAAPNVNFSVMSVETNLPNNQITWLNAVTDAEYK